ncbi:hypothetical protein ACQ4PT_049401 [Festuca glaucescens]
MDDPKRRCPVLPDEIMADEILARLPAKSVVACRSLSRAWAAALSSDDFIDLYHSLHGGRLKILRLHEEAKSYTDRHGAAPPDRMPLAISAGSFPRMVKMFWEDCQTIPVLLTTQCRGLVIVELSPMGLLYVCNPSTGQKRELPQGRTTGCGRNREWMHEYASLGLGYDVRSRRHKVVRIYHSGCDGEGRPASAGCEVYVLNGGSTDQSWRPVCAKPPGWVHPYKITVFAQGHVYWLAHRKHHLYEGYTRSTEMFIACFSVSEETFATVPPPPGVDSETLRKQCLTVLAGRLSLFSWGCPDHGQRYDVWLLREYGTNTGWDLHCRIDVATTSPEVYRFLGPRYDGGHADGYPPIVPLAIVDDGCRILLTRNELPNKIRSYAPLTGDIENILDFRSLQTLDPTPLEFAVYEESISTLGKQTCKDIILSSSPSTQALSLLLHLIPEHTLLRLMCVCRSWCTTIALYLHGRSLR